MVKINLLPHRQLKRKKIQQGFYVQLVIAAMIGIATVVVVALMIDMRTDHQNNINQIIANENQKLDAQVKEVASLTQEIDALKARQHAVENLQNDRNQSIYLMDDLAHQVPEGIYLYEVTQEEKTVTLNGFAQTNEHVSEFMRNIENNARWSENPQLQEIRSAYRQRTNNANHVFDFTMSIVLKTFSVSEEQSDSGNNNDDNVNDEINSDDNNDDDVPSVAPTDTPSTIKKDGNGTTNNQIAPDNNRDSQSPTAPAPVAPVQTPQPAPIPAGQNDTKNIPQGQNTTGSPQSPSGQQVTPQQVPASDTAPEPDPAITPQQ